MKRKMIVLCATVMLVVGMVSVNSFAYNVTTRQKIGSIYNGNNYSRTAYGILHPSGGVAELQLCSYSGGTVYARGTYPANPINPNRTRCSIPSYGYRYVFVEPLPNGSQAWGSEEYGLE